MLDCKVSLDELKKDCDVVSLHVHLNNETRHMINADFFNGRVKYLINTSRGAIVDEDAVISALADGRLKGYATDVLEDEFGDIRNSRLVERSKDLNIIITPHMAGTTIEAHTIVYRKALDFLKQLTMCFKKRV